MQHIYNQANDQKRIRQPVYTEELSAIKIQTIYRGVRERRRFKEKRKLLGVVIEVPDQSHESYARHVLGQERQLSRQNAMPNVGSGDDSDTKGVQEIPQSSTDISPSPSTAKERRKHTTTWFQWGFGIGKELEASGRPSSKLIHPLSPFGLTWIAITAIFLAYTALVTPPMIAFQWLDAECAQVPTLPLDVLLDCFFIVDVILNFNTGVLTMGEYVDDRWKVAKMYLKGSFFFDCFTSFPVSFFELVTAQACKEIQTSDVAGDSSESGGHTGLRLIRAIKPLRWFKIARIMKLGKAQGIVHLLLDHWNISPKNGKEFMVMLKLTMIIHIISCMWWLWKVLGMCDFSQIDAKEGGCDSIENWLDNVIPWGDMHQRKPLDSVEGKVEAYFVSVYLVAMTLTTVGFGDITACNTSERVGYALLFVVGAFIWGNLLAQITEIHVASAAREQEVLIKVQKTLDFLIENDCPPKLRTEIIQWTRLNEDNYDVNESKQLMVQQLPRTLQRILVRHLYSREVSRVPVFSYIESHDDSDAALDKMQETFISEVFLQFEYKTFTPGDVVINFSDPADRLVIIVSGSVRVEFEHSQIQLEPLNLSQGQFVGDMAILGEKDWAVSTCFGRVCSL